MADINITVDSSQVKSTKQELLELGNSFNSASKSASIFEQAFARAAKQSQRDEQYIKATSLALRSLINDNMKITNAYKSAEQSASAFTEQLRKQEAQAVKTAKANQAAINKQLGVGGPSAVSQGAGGSAMEAEIDRLRIKYDQVYASSNLYEKSLVELNRAHMLGVTSTKQHEAAVESLNLEYQNFQNGVAQAGNRFSQHINQSASGMNNLGVAAQQTGYQVSDFIVQVQGGTNPLVAFSQQATQLAGLLYLLPPALQNASRTIAGFTVTLSTAFAGITILIPLLSMLAMAFFNSSKEAEDTTASMNSVDESVKRLTQTTADLNLEWSKLKLGVGTSEEAVIQEQVNALLKEQLALVTVINAGKATSRAGTQLEQDRLKLVKEELKGLQEKLGLLEEARVQLEKANYINDYMAAAEEARYIAIARAERDRIDVSESLLALMKSFVAAAGSAVVVVNNIGTAAEGVLGKVSAFVAKLWEASMIKIQANEELVRMKFELSDAGQAMQKYAGRSTTSNKEIEDSFGNVIETISGTGGGGGGGSVVQALTEAEQAAKELADTLDGYVINAVESLGSAWGDFVVSGFTDFKGFASSVLDSFKSMIANMIALAAKNQIMLNLGIAGGGAGGIVGGLTAPGGPLGGLGGLAGKVGAFGGNLITGALGFVKSIGAGVKGISSYLTTALTGVKSLATLGTALGAVALPIAAVVAAVSFFKKKVKILDTGLNVAVDGVNAFVTSFQTKETKRFWGLSKKVRTTESGVGADVSDPIQDAVTNMQQSVVDAAAAFGYGADSFKNFTYEFRLSLKDLTEEQQMQKINEELTKMGDAFASMLPQVSSMNELLEAAQQRYDLTTRLLQLQGNEEELIVRQRQAELAAVHPLNKELLLRVHSLEEEQRAAEKVRLAAEEARIAAEQAAEQARAAVEKIRLAAEQAVDAASDAVKKAFTALKDSVDAIVSGLTDKLKLANEAADRSRGIFNQLRSALSGRSISGGGVEASKSLQSSAFSFLSKGNFQDEEALKEALDIVGQPTEALYGSFEEYARDFYKTSAVISEAKSLAEEQLSQDQKQIELLEAQIDAAEAQYKLMVDQYNALLGIDNSVLSLSQAISNLSVAIATEEATKKALEKSIATEAATKKALENNIASEAAAKKALENKLVAEAAARYSLENKLAAEAEARRVLESRLVAEAAAKKALEDKLAAEIKAREAAEAAVVSDKPVYNLKKAMGFASGGMHSGGVRVVGEEGPELEFTGPSRIVSNKQSASMFRDPELRDAIMSLKSEVSGLRSDQLQIQMDISKYTKRSYDIERKWDVEGLPATRI